MKSLFLTTLLFIMGPASALPPAPNDAPPAEQVFINANIHVGNGQVLENAQFAIADGKITRAGYYKIAYTGDEIDLQGQHIYPGFILTATNLGLTEVDSFKATLDFNETGQLNPNVRSLIAYNTDSERIPAMRYNGILLAQTTPSGGLVSGTSSVVQLDAWNWEDAVVAADNGLHVNWPAEWAKRFDWSTFSMQLQEDKKYAEKISQIKQLFEEARVDQSQTNMKLNAVKPVFSGDKTVYIHSNSPKAIIESIQYFQSLGIDQPVLVTNQAAEQVLSFIAQSGVSVILTAVHTLPHQSDSSIDAAYALPAKLQKAGILTALSYPGSMSSRNLSFTAGTTVAYGNSATDALQMITLNPAKILGIDGQYGSLEVGKSATFFISQGDALDMRSNRIAAAYIDGREIVLDGRQQALYERFKQKLKQ
ncbi:amidohydrolase family protein [Marinicella meishanensis]|uniref:amidohydrolase family protein n=1 Tax=Marinicella meishanensis TaxID=2873263 RepID=UPI001CC0829B|nr:amidohydrolase family protein [Marinicella sp. NBU2979]